MKLSPIDLEWLPYRARVLFDAIAHGDDEHRAWLEEAIENHFTGKPVPPVRGKGLNS